MGHSGERQVQPGRGTAFVARKKGQHGVHAHSRRWARLDLADVQVRQLNQ